jgi:alkylation response protein AidB-like acyl-CoA dehydrogenase
MDFRPTEEQAELGGLVREALSDADTLGRLRATANGRDPFDRELWHRLAVEVGLQGLLVPEELGGVGGDLVDAVAVFEELGRAVACGPFLSTAVHAVTLLLGIRRSAADELLTRIASGEVIAATAMDRDPPLLTLHRQGTGGRLHGELQLVPFGDIAEVFLVRSSGGDLIAAFPGAGVQVTRGESIDPSQRFTRVRFSDARAEVLAEGGELTANATDAARIAAALALSAERVGATLGAADMATAYAKQRRQFGRAVGSFQSIKHALADVAVELEYARTATWLAAWEASNGGTDERLVRAAAAQSAEALQLAATTNIQVHGAIAMTWEHDAHWFLKRAMATRALLGSPNELFRDAADGIDLGDVGDDVRRGRV